MTHAIKAEFRYEARHAEGTQTAAETVASRSGTCRDFAVLMMEALRSFGVATRFVTGYLYDDTSGTNSRRRQCLLVGIVATNIVPRLFPRSEWPTRTRALALISDLSLNVFLAMSLMSMQLWTLGGLGPALVVVLAVQTIAAVAYIVFVVFPAMGRNYQAAVISAGFTGVSLGATPTAIANMTAVTKLHGACAQAFIILPLVSAFFIDIANAAAIGFMAR